MDRLARNLDDLRALVRALTGEGVRVEFVKEQLTFTGKDSPMANLLLSVMGAFAEFEQALIRERQREGIALAKTHGAYRGRKQSVPHPGPGRPTARKRRRRREQSCDRPEPRDQPANRLPVPASGARPTGGNAELTAVLATVPTDKRPLPSVAAYDDLLPSRPAK